MKVVDSPPPGCEAFAGADIFTHGHLRSGCDCKILQSYRIQNPEFRIQELQAKGLCPGAGRLIEFIFYDTTLESTYLRKALGFHSGF
jgi:hypothetical protein